VGGPPHGLGGAAPGGGLALGWRRGPPGPPAAAPPGGPPPPPATGPARYAATTREHVGWGVFALQRR
jgi:hypothetical protein